MRKLLINLLIVVCLSLTACSSNGLTKKISENSSNSKDSGKSAVSNSEANSSTVTADSAESKTTVNRINTNIGSLHVLVGVPYTIEVSESNFNFTILDEYDSIPLITSIEVEKAKNGLTVKSREDSVSAIRLEKDGFEPEELTIYAHECTSLSSAQEKAIKEVTDGKIDVIAIKSTVHTDYVDLFQKKLVLSRMKSIKTLEGVDGESHWITITDAKSRIYWAFYDAMSNLKVMDFTLMYPDNDLKKSLLKQCEDNLFEMLEHLKGNGIEKHGDYYVIKLEYESEDGTILPELRISRENV